MRLPSILRTLSPILVLLSAGSLAASAQTALPIPPRVVERVDDTRLTRLSGNTHPLARAQYDRGLVDPARQLAKIALVLKRSPEQEHALAAFNERQYDSKSPDFHHWLSATEFGQLYGPSDSDLTQVTSWLQNHGFSIDEVAKGRGWLYFTGTVAQVQEAFHLEMHTYLVNGETHISNDRDPSIPSALAPVIAGIASLNDIFPKSPYHPGPLVARDAKTGRSKLLERPSETPSGEIVPVAGTGSELSVPFIKPNPDFSYTDSYGYVKEDLTAYDLATIYNVLPLWQASTPINGTGVTVAVVATSDIVATDIANYRQVSGLPATTVNTIETDPSTDPGTGTNNGNDKENEVDLEMVSAAAPGATLDLVVSASTATTNGDQISSAYIVDNEVAPIATSSYGLCEPFMLTAGNAAFNSIWQQGATEGISIFVSAGDQGSTGCDSQNTVGPAPDTIGAFVNGRASSPYVTAVGGTDLAWYYDQGTTPRSTYWNTTADANGATAKGYMPELAWNTTCSNPLLLQISSDPSTGEPYTTPESFCEALDTNANLKGIVSISGGSGGHSTCSQTSQTSTYTACVAGYPKPSWQPALSSTDTQRDLPDLAMFASYGYDLKLTSADIPSSTILFCITSFSPDDTCNYSDPSQIVYQENGGTSAATPYTAGVMAMILQKNGGAKQGLANPVFYKMGAAQSATACNSNTVAAGNSCYFHDVTQGSNAMVCTAGGPQCTATTSGDTLGILGAEINGSYVNFFNAGTGYDLATGLGSMNIANIVNGWSTLAGSPTITRSPTSLTFASTAVGSTTAAQVVTIENTGTAAVTLTSETITGTDASSFIKSSTTCGTSLAAAASCTVSVEFKPAASGTLSASLSIADNATGSPQTVALTGTGAPSSLTYTVSLSNTSLTWGGTTPVGTTSSTVGTVTIKNTGTGAVTISSETITGTDASSFIKSATTCTTSLAVGASCSVSVEFKPAAAGTLTATLSIADNATGTPQTVALTGTGAATSTYTVSLSNTSLAWGGTTPVGSTSSTVGTVTIKNTGTGAVTISSETITGTDASSFIKSATTCTTSLAVGASCTVSVEFKPAAAGTLTATLSIADNATGTPQTVALTGTGAATSTYTVSLSNTSLTWGGTTPVGTTSGTVGNVTIKNTGTGAVTISSETITGADASSFIKSATTCTTSLAVGASCTVSVEFKPAAAGTLTATLSIADNATGTPQTVALTGTGAASATPTVTLTPTTIAFPATIAGTTSDAQIVTLKNTSTVAVTLTSIVMGGTNASSFPQINNCGTSLAASASCSIYIAFDPASAAALTGTLSVTDNATGSPQKVTVSGTGTTSPSVKLSVTSIAFPTTTHATTSEAVPVTLTNSGTATLDLTSITLTGTNPTDFEQLNTCGATLAPAGTCTVYVAFKPATAAAFTAKLTITDNGSASPQYVTLTGTGN